MGHRLSQDHERQFVKEYLIDLDPSAAAERMGILKSTAYFGKALLARPRVKAQIQAEMDARRVRLEIDADFVLSELVRQLARLRSKLDADMADLYNEEGAFKPIKEWPKIWRKWLVTSMDVQDTYVRSSDGVQAEDSKSWDKSGVITKIKRVDALAIERQITEVLREIGNHVKVGAFQKNPEELHVHFHTEIDRKIAEGRRRAAQITGAVVAPDAIEVTAEGVYTAGETVPWREPLSDREPVPTD